MVTRKEENPFYVAWHREEGRDSYEAEKAQPVKALLSIQCKSAVITDIYGNQRTLKCNNGAINLELCGRPVYIDIIN